MKATRGLPRLRTPLVVAAFASCATRPPATTEPLPRPNANVSSGAVNGAAPRSTPGDDAPPPVTGEPWVRALQDQLAALRELPFRQAVPWSHQSRDDFRKTVRSEIARELGRDKAKLLSRAAFLMGFVAKPTDLAAALEDAQTTQVAAYYEPREKVFRVVHAARPNGQPPPDAQPIVVAHELVHALQDQHFDLVAYDGGPQNAARLTDDERAARHFVVEGEATFLMMAREVVGDHGRPARLGPFAVASVRMALTMLAAADMTKLALLAQTGNADADEETREEMEQLAKLPPMIVLPLIEPYFKGAFFVSEVWGRGGWPAVSRLFEAPPQSTEQVLHPAEKFGARPEPPINVQLSRPPALPWATSDPALSDVQGELGWRVYFQTWAHADPAAAAAGWGGDRYWVWQVGSGARGRLVALTATRWDDADAAARFCADYVTSLRKRFRAARDVRIDAASTQRITALRTRAGSISVVACSDRDVDVIDGATVAEIPALLEAARDAERKPLPARRAAATRD